MGRVNTTVNPIHFEDFDGHQFERLAFAYLLRRYNWETLDWYGVVGSDGGRDIWGKRIIKGKLSSVCIQCVNRKRLTLKKVIHDVALVVAGPQGKPDVFHLISGGVISAQLRDNIKKVVLAAGIRVCDVWAGVEFEESLRRDAEPLLKRFVEGTPFPEDITELQSLTASLLQVDDKQILRLMAEVFSRPAFTTPFTAESNIPDFKKAISDTIEALNTGIRRMRDGTEIMRIPSRHQIQDDTVRAVLDDIVSMLTRLRARFDSFIKEGEIRPCGCDIPDCPTIQISPRAGMEMDKLREDILSRYATVYPAFTVHVKRW